MRTKTPRHALALVLSALAVPCLFVGCGSQATEICAQSCSCTGCSSDEQQSCVAQIQGSEMEAGEVGCSSQASAYESCVEGGTCIDSVFVVDGCDIQLNALKTCLAASNCTLDVDVVHCS
jgi:hypothetical protein